MSNATLPSLSSLRYDHATLADLRVLLADWTARGWLRELDQAFANFLIDEAPDAPVLLILAAALASHQLGRGHVCLDLEATLNDASFALSLPPEGEGPGSGEAPLLPGVFLAGLSVAHWQHALQHALLVGGSGDTPLVLVGTRLYLRRYWQYERQVRDGIAARLDASVAARAHLPVTAIRATLDVLFAKAPHGRTDWQKLACALAAGNRFSIITGGPGTGKTTTVVKLLALLQSLALQAPVARAKTSTPGIQGRALRIRLAAPTGKAAARLNESIAQAVDRLPLAGLARADEIRAAIPKEVVTLHRLLGSRPDTRHFKHHAHNPLALEVLVIDEASMIDLEMMSAVLAALPPHASLVLLGDKDQLASVEAGAVLGELCRHAAEGRYTAQTVQWLQDMTGETWPERTSPSEMQGGHGSGAANPTIGLSNETGTPLDQAVAMLRESYRFTAGSGIGRLAEAVNAGAVAETARVWAHGYADLARLTLDPSHGDGFQQLVVDGVDGDSDSRTGVERVARVGYKAYLQTLQQSRPEATAGAQAFDQWAKTILLAHSRFQILCGLRRGAYGVEGLNLRIAAILQAQRLISASAVWYEGRPVLVTRNDYGLGLMNGDIGMTLAVPAPPPASAVKSGRSDPLPTELTRASNQVLRVAFLASDGTGTIRWVLPSRLQAVETVFAMTVHKSQGSEFDHTALVLPDRLNPILTRELIYTGITRARRWFTLASGGRDHRVFDAAIQRRVLRASGLAEDQ